MSTAVNQIKVKEIMHPVSKIPLVYEKQYLKIALEIMTKYSFGIACVVDKDLVLKGVMTDGDIRRMVLNEQKPLPGLFLDDTIDHARLDFLSINENATISDAIMLVEKKRVWDLPVINDKGIIQGLLHLHSIVQKLT